MLGIMKSVASLRKLEVSCDVAFILALLLSGLGTATMWHVLTTPLPEGEHRIDLVDQIGAMAGILNLALPVGLVSLIFSTTAKIRARKFEPFSVIIALAGFVGVFACAIVMYGCFVAMHPGVHLWSRIWWRFGA